MDQKPEKTTFTKSIMTIIMYLYFFGAIVGTILIAASLLMDIRLDVQISTDMFIAYAAYLGGPTATAIGFYAWKSKAENLLKIKNTQTKEREMDTISILANMGGNN